VPCLQVITSKRIPVERGYSTSLLTATGSAGALKRCTALSVVGLITVAVAPILMYHGDPVGAVGLFLLGGIVLLGSVFYALRRTVCPRCQLPWLMYALGEKSIHGWFSWLTTITECPQCNFSVRDAAESQPHANA